MNSTYNLYIHGNESSSKCFDYIRSHIKGNDILIDYDSDKGFYHNLDSIIGYISKLDGKIKIISHSLGGIYALHIKKLLPKKIISGITISTPFSGSEYASMLSLVFPHKQVFKDIMPNSSPLTSIKSLNLEFIWTNIITESNMGGVFIYGKNDGVISVASQKSRNDMKQFTLPLDHFSVLTSKDTVNIIQKSLNL